MALRQGSIAPPAPDLGLALDFGCSRPPNWRAGAPIAAPNPAWQPATRSNAVE
jgi:hypothetical protein